MDGQFRTNSTEFTCIPSVLVVLMFNLRCRTVGRLVILVLTHTLSDGFRCFVVHVSTRTLSDGQAFCKFYTALLYSHAIGRPDGFQCFIIHLLTHMLSDGRTVFVIHVLTHTLSDGQMFCKFYNALLYSHAIGRSDGFATEVLRQSGRVRS